MATDILQGTVTNGDSVPLVQGMVVRISANRTCVRAQADTAPHLQGVYGVVVSGSVAPGGSGVVVALNATNMKVLLETGLTLAAGQTLYISAATAGRATNVAPGAPLAVAIGTIADTSSYATDGRVFAAVGTPIDSSVLTPFSGVAVYVTPSVDISAVALTFNTPVAAGKTFHAERIVFEMASRSAPVTGNLTLDLAQNGASIDENLGPGAYSFSQANINLKTTPPVDLLNNITIAPPADMTNFPLQVLIANVPTGGTLHGRFALYGRYS